MDTTSLLSNFVIASTMILGLLMLGFYILGQEKVREALLTSENNIGFIIESLKQGYLKFSYALTPKSDGDTGKKYQKFLMYSPFDTRAFFLLKNSLFIVVTLFCLAVAITDSKLGVEKLYTKFEYYSDPTYSTASFTEDEKARILVMKNEMFDYMGEEIGFDMIVSYGEETSVSIIGNYISAMNETGIPNKIIATEIFKKAQGYMEAKRINYLGAMLKGFIAYFIPELIILLINFLNKSNERAEKRFLKRLIIMNGSIKPTDFMMVLSELIDKSKYFKKILLEIEDSNKKNYEENTKIYQKYIQESKDLETKLFFEKLDEANNYDFDQAIVNIKNEFNLDKRMQTRKVKKTVENIHVWGLVGFMALIVLIIMYLLMPWMEGYDLGSMM